ncbi:MAG TPA: hypothetical protein VE326_11465 [Candidatus Binatia bacterium]|nr:hypothetical protein [Candidatus Binatia bacterium]
MGTTLSLVDGAAEVRFAAAGMNYDSPYKCKSYDFGSPTIREVVTDATGVSGTVDLSSLTGSRQVQLALTVWNDDAGTRHQHLDTLRAICQPARRPWLYAQCDGWEQQRRIQLRATPMTCTVGSKNTSYLEVSLAFAAPTGLFEALEPVVTGPAYPQTGAGFSLDPGDAGSAALYLAPGDAGSPALSLAAGDGGNLLTITNVGSAPAAPVFTITGPCASPQIINYTTGVRIAFGNYTVPDGHSVVIDVARRTVLLDGDPAQSLYNRVDWSVSRWFLLEPGTTTLAFASGDDGASGQLVVQHSPRFF